MNKEALICWLQLRLDGYRKRNHEAKYLHLDIRAAEVVTILDAIKKKTYQDVRVSKQTQMWDGFGADGDSI